MKQKVLVLCGLILIIILFTFYCFPSTSFLTVAINSEEKYRRDIHLYLPAVKRKQDEFSELCPDASSVVVSVIVGGRLGNHVWEYLSVWATARDHPGVWPTVPQQILDTLQHTFSPLAVPALEDLAQRCNASFLLDEFKNCSSGGNYNLLKTALNDKSRTRPFLLVLPKYQVDVHETVDHWPELWLQLPFTKSLQNSSQATLHEIAKKMRNAQELQEDEPLEFVGVHVRRTDYASYITSKFSDAVVADENFYFKAMDEMRRQLQPRRCAFVVVSDDLAWCRRYLNDAPDVEIAGTGDAKDPGSDLALLSACNHTVFAYGTYGLTAAMQNPHGRTIVHAGGGNKNAIVVFAKILNWTLV